jgi:NAD(P)-dependent dehydrogenase (short-subunit alcohol dehydrogenase family)
LSFDHERDGQEDFMPTVMITGANRGLGLEFAREYASEGWTVIATCRDPAKASELKAAGKAIEVHGLDVADFPAIDRLAEKLKGRPIDVLINNAGVIGSERRLGELDGERWLATLRVNSVAPILVAQAFLANLRAGADKKAVFITSMMGSIADNSSGGYYDYRSSKAALNAAVKSFAIDTAPESMIAVVLHPGWVQTDMGGPNAPVARATSVGNMRKVIARLKQRDSGRFFNFDGKELPW